MLRTLSQEMNYDYQVNNSKAFVNFCLFFLQFINITVAKIVLNLIIASAGNLLTGQTANLSTLGLKELNCREPIITPFGTFYCKLFKQCLLILKQVYCVSMGRVS